MNDSDNDHRRLLIWFFSWVFFLVANIAILVADWQLRDKGGDRLQPMPGGLPDAFEGVAFLTPIFLAIALSFSLPKAWHTVAKALCIAAQLGIAFIILLFGRIYYVLEFGIDTL